MFHAILDWLRAGFTQATWWQMALYLIVCAQLTMMSTTLFLHRSATHRGCIPRAA